MRKILSFVSLIAVFGLISFASFRPTLAQETAGQGLEITKPLYEIDTDPGATVTFEILVRNITDSEVIARAEVNDFAAQGEEGQPAVILDDTEPYPYSLKDWVSDIPELRLAAQEQGTVTVTLNVPADASPGGHYGVVRFTALPPELEDTGVSLSASLGSLVLVNVSGDVTEELSVEEFFVSRDDQRGTFFEYGPLTFTERLNNTGNVHLKPTGMVEVKNMIGRTVATLTVNETERNVLPDSIRRFDQTLDKKWWFGRYSATLDLTYGDGQTVQTTLNFWVVPYKVLAIAVTGLILLVLLVILLSRRYRRRVMQKAQAEVRTRSEGAGPTPGNVITPNADETAKTAIPVSGDSDQASSEDDGSPESKS